MENHPHSVWNATYNNDDFLFEPTTSQFSPYEGYLEAIPFSKSYAPHETFPIESFPETLPTEPPPLNAQEHDFCDVLLALSEGDRSGAAVFPSHNDGENVIEDLKDEQGGEKKRYSVRTLSKEKIAAYFYLPITQAAKELNVALTSLKRRCRELGIQRWPRRKLRSLQALIKDVQEHGEECEDEGKIRAAIQILEKEKKVMEETPGLELDNDTIKLRQTCSKIKYKKKKLKSMKEILEAEIRMSQSSCTHDPPEQN